MRNKESKKVVGMASTLSVYVTNTKSSDVFIFYLMCYASLLIRQMAGRSEDALEYERLALELMANNK